MSAAALVECHGGLFCRILKVRGIRRCRRKDPSTRAAPGGTRRHRHAVRSAENRRRRRRPSLCSGGLRAPPTAAAARPTARSARPRRGRERREERRSALPLCLGGTARSRGFAARQAGKGARGRRCSEAVDINSRQSHCFHIKQRARECHSGVRWERRPFRRLYLLQISSRLGTRPDQGFRTLS